MLQALGLGRACTSTERAERAVETARSAAGNAGLVLALAAPGLVGLIAALLVVHVMRANSRDLLATDVASRIGREAREIHERAARESVAAPPDREQARIDIAAIDAEFGQLAARPEVRRLPLTGPRDPLERARRERWLAWCTLRPELARVAAGSAPGPDESTRRVALASAFERSAAKAAEAESAAIARQSRGHIRWLVVLLLVQVTGLAIAAGLKLLDRRRLRRIEHVLRRLSAITEHSRASIALCHLDGRIDWANAAFGRSIGQAPPEIVGRNLADVLSPAAPTGTEMRALLGAWKAGRSASAELELNRRDGTSLWAATELVPMVGDDGRLERYALVLNDVTPRVLAARALSASEERFRGALEALTEGLVILDAEDRIVEANVAAATILGTTVAEMIGRSAHPFGQSVVAADGRPVPWDELPIVVARRTGRPQRSSSLGWRLPDGEIRWIECAAAPVQLPGVAGTGVVGTFVDVSERRDAEARIARLTHVVEQSPVLVMLTDREHRIEYVNRAFERRTGWTLDEVRGRTSSFMLSARTQPAAFANVLEELSRHGEWCSEIWNVSRDGSEWLALSHAYPLRSEDGRESYVALLEDITEQRRREDELAHAREEALAASRAKSEFLQNMSHELHTPLNGILGMAELLLETPLDDCQRNDLRQVCRSARDLHTLINHLFDFARLEDGAAAAQAVPFRLRECLESVTHRFAADAKERGLACDIEIDPRLPDGLRGDPGALVRVLRLLADNAIKFTDKGRVRLRVLREPGPGGEPHVRFEVHDTGIGIPAERQKEIFEAFWQADGSSTRRFGGVGLGLALASKLTRLMGGRLAVASEPGKGSVFSFSVPLRDPVVEVAPSPPAEAAPAPGPAGDGTLRALVVDDNAVNRRVATRLLERAAFEVATAADGIEAVERYMEGAWDVVLMDVQMPRLDGIEATRRIRAFEREAIARRVPVLAVTANTLQEDLPALRDAGMDELVPKPIAPEQLYAAMTRVLGRPVAATAASESGRRAA